LLELGGDGGLAGVGCRSAELFLAMGRLVGRCSWVLAGSGAATGCGLATTFGGSLSCVVEPEPLVGSGVTYRPLPAAKQTFPVAEC
jgi:hypothetical protein